MVTYTYYANQFHIIIFLTNINIKIIYGKFINICTATLLLHHCQRT